MRSSIFVLTATLFLSCGPHSRSVPEVRIAIGGRAALDFVPVYIASSLGFFHDAGLQVSIQDLAGTAKAVQSLLGGSSDVVAGGYDAAFQMAGQGKRLQSVAVIERWPPLVLVASNSTKPIRTVRELKGATVGISSPGSSSHQFLNYLLSKNGLSPSDVTPVGVGVNFTMAAAMEHGKVTAAIAGPLGRALLVSNVSVTSVVDCRSAEGARTALGTDNLPFITLMTRSEWTHDNTETVRRLGSAIARSLRWIHAHSAEQVMRAIPDEYKGTDSALYLNALRDILPVFSSDGRMPKDGPSHMRDFLLASDPTLLRAHFRLEDTYTDAYVAP